MDNGKIIGVDYRMCACCGGYFIEIGDSTYRFSALPENSEIEITDTIFPVFVSLNWMKKKDQCLGDEIIVTAIREN
jgi:hypothetical protein